MTIIATSHNLQPDLEASRFQDGRRCVVTVGLASLDPHWGTGLGANRSII